MSITISVNKSANILHICLSQRLLLMYEHGIAFHLTIDNPVNETIITNKTMADAKDRTPSIVFRFYMISRLSYPIAWKIQISNGQKL